MAASTASPMPQRGDAERPWRAGAAWLLFLGPFFFATYNTANWLASQRTQVPSVVFEWEQALPFVPWTILPYWSIDAFYVLSLFTCASRAEVGTLGRRLLTAQVVAVICFIAMPLRFSFNAPTADGVFGAMFAALAAFDKPFNQAPSLHIALLVILWVHFAPKLGPALRSLLHGWFALIGISVLTTYQHHFIDVPTGALLGFFCLWLWPADPQHSPLGSWHLTADPAARRLAGRYALGALACLVLAAIFRGPALWLCWGGISLGLVAAAYLGAGASVFQKSAIGRHSLASSLLFAPYLLGARINVWCWTRRQPPAVEIADGVWLGRYPSSRILQTLPVRTVIDLAAEMAGTLGWRRVKAVHAQPCLDLLMPPGEALEATARQIELSRGQGPVLVCCALGYSRSASAVIAWLLRTGRDDSVAQALERIRAHRPVVLDVARLERLLDVGLVPSGQSLPIRQP